MGPRKPRSADANAKAFHTAKTRDNGIGAWRRKLRRQLFAGRRRVRCCFCGRELTFRKATLEHVVPRSLGGPNVLQNLRISCARCNNERGVEDFELFRARKEQERCAR